MCGAMKLLWHPPLQFGGLRWHSRRNVLVLVCLIGAPLGATSLVQQSPGTGPVDEGSTNASQSVTIPDGTPVRLRFAQPLRGKVPCLWKRPPCGSSVVPQAEAEDTVRLVSASDVRVNHFVVIAKGAIGEATVTKVWHPLMALTGLAMRLDWIEDVTGKHVPLRIEKDGKQESFTVQVMSTPGGMLARRETLHGDLVGSDSVNASLIWRKKNWIPSGTRIMAFVHGSVVRDLGEVRDAQTLLSMSSDIATLTVYRTKGREDSHPHVSCDDHEMAQVGSAQYTTYELTPGVHRCRADDQGQIEITAQAGEDYFAQLRTSSLTGVWELKLMDAGEAEDIISTLEVAGKH
jgi:hypothetical protein